MKRIIIGITVFLALIVFAQSAHAQYRVGIGARMGPYLGLTVKGNLNEVHSIEGILETRRKGFLLTALYELHLSFRGVDGLRLYAGIGGHVGYSSAAWLNAPTGNYTHRPTFGFDGIVGIEYTFDAIPINIGADFKPILNYWDGFQLYTDNWALAIRYVFK